MAFLTQRIEPALQPRQKGVDAAVGGGGSHPSTPNPASHPNQGVRALCNAVLGPRLAGRVMGLRRQVVGGWRRVKVWGGIRGTGPRGAEGLRSQESEGELDDSKL